MGGSPCNHAKSRRNTQTSVQISPSYTLPRPSKVSCHDSPLHGCSQRSCRNTQPWTSIKHNSRPTFIDISRADTMELAWYLCWKSFCSCLWWSSHWDDHSQGTRWSSRRKWMDSSTGTSWYCLYWSSRFPLESVTCDLHQTCPPGHSLYDLLKNAYVAYTSELAEDENVLSFNDWCSSRAKTCPHFHFWSIILKLEIDMLIYVPAIRIIRFSSVCTCIVKYCTVVLFRRSHTLCEMDTCTHTGHGSITYKPSWCIWTFSKGGIYSIENW